MFNQNKWEKIAWSKEHQHVLYREWGIIYSSKHRLTTASNYYDKSLELKNDPKVLYKRSRCKRTVANAKGAYKDSKAALVMDNMNQFFNLEFCDSIYEMNEFEKCKVELHNNLRKFTGAKKEPFNDRIVVVEENLKDSLGDTLGPFILRNEQYFPSVMEHIAKLQNIDTRPLWKILKEAGKCDVLSVLEKEDILLSPREIARRVLAFKVFIQIYFSNSWSDFLFLKNLKSDPNLLLPQSFRSTPYLEMLTNKRYEIVMKFLKMLQARSPLYSETVRKCPNKKVCEKHKEDILFRVQYQTHRDMITILRKVKQLRFEENIEKLSKYVEEAMGKYVVLKTNRIMPWKFEFLNEVYNVLALAYCDSFKTPPNISNLPSQDKLKRLLILPIEKYKERITAFIFGDKSTYNEADAPDFKHIAYKKLVSRLENRIHFAKYPIERSYLFHAISRCHMQHNRFDECVSVARKGIEEAKLCKSYVWMFLGLMLICKSYAILRRIERFKEVISEALSVVKYLKSPRLQEFLSLCSFAIDEQIEEKIVSLSSMGSLIKQRKSRCTQEAPK